MKHTNMGLVDRLKTFMENEARSCSIDILSVNGSRLKVHGNE